MDMGEKHGYGEQSGCGDKKITPKFIVPHDKRHQKRQAGVSREKEPVLKIKKCVQPLNRPVAQNNLLRINAYMSHAYERRPYDIEYRHGIERKKKIAGL